MLTVLQGGQAGFFFDEQAEIIGVIEATQIRDPADRVVAGAQKLRGLLQPQPTNIFLRGLAQLLDKQTAKIGV